ncbi:FecR domain-containing protein [Occallatibacter savannae]|uniref:FecR domain-containing protein n=1 Tax=Occallatibacter savannae TaxID=1002691 RepID=UPI000D69741C|nr:FecR domain-containing protein [Occallatibacter savannae]
MNDYLWDRTGRDAEVEQIENLLAPYRHIDQQLEFREPPLSPAKWASRRYYFASATAAVLIIVAVISWHTTSSKQRITATAIIGAPRIDEVPMASASLDVGSRIETGFLDRVRIQVGDMGWVQVEPDSILRLIENRPERRRFRLEHGEILARISAPPAAFIVETPVARAIDLGCTYHLRFSQSGEGAIEVTEGWVEVDRGFEQTLVPAGASANFRPRGISPSYMQKTSPEFRDAMLEWWDSPNPSLRSTALARLLSSATKQDAYTLLNMLHRSPPEDRAGIYDRLNQLVPAPREVSRAAVLAGEARAEDAWWTVVERELGLGNIKKKGPLQLNPYWPQ